MTSRSWVWVIPHILVYEQTSTRMLLEVAELESIGVSFYGFEYIISIVNVIFMKNGRFYEIYVINSNNVFFYFLLDLLVNSSYCMYQLIYLTTRGI